MTFNQDSISYISTPSLPDINNYNPNDELGSNNGIDVNIPIENDSLNNECNDIFFDPIVEDDQFDDFILCADDPDVFYDGIDVDKIPTTDSGDCAYTIEEVIPEGLHVSGHVLLNQCGSLLDRKSHCINRSKQHKHFYKALSLHQLVILFLYYILRQYYLF